MRSDGLSIPKSLKKNQCIKCGLGINLNVDKMTGYFRSDGTSKFEQKRHLAVAKGLIDLVDQFGSKNVLEIGSANYSTLNEVGKNFPRVRFTGIEPSDEGRSPSTVTNVEPHNITLEDFQASTRFDLVFSNQVIEHFRNPISFLSACERLITLNGTIIVCCPNHWPVSNELLFSDHLFHFTPASLALAGNLAGLALIDHSEASWDRDTRIFRFGKSGAREKFNFDSPTENTLNLLTARKQLIENWASQDALTARKLNSFPSRSIYLYGAGEFSQLIQCYLPNSFNAIQAIVLNDIRGARRLPKPVVELSKIQVHKNDLVLLGARREVRQEIINSICPHKFQKNQLVQLSV
jgi:SAM-dependent methyltransferase